MNLACLNDAGTPIFDEALRTAGPVAAAINFGVEDNPASARWFTAARQSS